MKQDLDCMIVQDLLPQYIEKSTSDITNEAVEEHLNSCEQCSEVFKNMNVETDTKKNVPQGKLKFLKKIKHTRLIVAVSCIVLALIFSYMIYASEYKFTNDKKVLSTAITEYTSHEKNIVEDAYVLETKEIDGVLIAFYKDNKNSNIYGFAKLLKGINMKYRLVEANYDIGDYSAIVNTHKFETNNGAYYTVGGYNLAENIASYGLKLNEDRNSNSVQNILKFNIENSQFLDIKKQTDIYKSFEQFQENPALGISSTVVLLDSNGNDITKSYRIPDITSSGGGGVSTAELFMLYVFIGIVLILGAIFARYHWSKK